MTVLALVDVRADGGTQSRAFLDSETVHAYADAYAAGATMPPPVVFFDGSVYWLADGFHRVRALYKAGIYDADFDVRQGTQRDAILYACGANATHGKPRTNADKRRAVETLLRDEEWGKRSDRWIAETCAVGHSFVSKLRGESTVHGGQTEPRQSRDGKTRDVTNIGRRAAPDPQPLNFDPDPTPRTEPRVVLEPVQHEPEPATAPARTVSALDRFKDAFLTLFRVLPSPTQTAAKLWLKDWLEGGAS